MRTGLIVYGLDRPLSGVSRYTAELARALVALREELDLVLLIAGRGDPLPELDTCERARLPGCRLLPGLVTLGNVVLPAVARQLGLDVVHDPTGVTPFGLGAGGARTVVTLHDVFPWSCPGNSTRLETLIYRHWLPRVVPHVDAVITDSQASRSDILRYLRVRPAVVHIVPLAASDLYRAAAHAGIEAVRSRYGLPTRYLLYVGSVERRKNLEGLLSAYARLRRMAAAPPLVVVGARRHASAGVMEALTQLGLEGAVVFAGHVPEKDLPALYSGADLFAFPSLYEGFGLPPLEAMACGTPVVCSNAASLPEVVGEAAIMVAPTDVEGWAEAMHRVLTDETLQRTLQEKGLRRASRFSWERTARETVEAYRDVCGTGA